LFCVVVVEAVVGVTVGTSGKSRSSGMAVGAIAWDCFSSEHVRNTRIGKKE
jgi:hypothetical protein